MVNILLYRLKAILKSRIYIGGFIGIAIMLGLIVSFVEMNSTHKQVFNISIIDRDQSEASKELIESVEKDLKVKISHDTDVDKSKRRLIKGDYDALYVIKEGFGKQVGSNKNNELIKVYKNDEAINIDWLSDQIAIIALKEWISYDMLERINSVDKSYTYEKYMEDYTKAVETEKIFFLEQHNMKLVNKDDKGLPIIFKQIWAFSILIFLVSYGKKGIVDRGNGILMRYEFLGIGKTGYYVIDLCIKVVTLLIPYLVSIGVLAIILGLPMSIMAKGIVLTVIYICVTWFIATIIGLAFDNIKGYAFASQIFVLMTIFYAMLLPTEGILGMLGKLIFITTYVG